MFRPSVCNLATFPPWLGESGWNLCLYLEQVPLLLTLHPIPRRPMWQQRKLSNTHARKKTYKFFPSISYVLGKSVYRFERLCAWNTWYPMFRVILSLEIVDNSLFPFELNHLQTLSNTLASTINRWGERGRSDDVKLFNHLPFRKNFFVVRG